MSEQLKPCPFCGGAAHFFKITDLDKKNFGGDGICCGSCPITTDLMFSLMEDCKPKLAEAWNRRAQPAQSVPITSETGNQAAQGASAITSVPLLTVEEIQAAWVEHGLDDCAVEDFAKAIEQAVRAKLEVAAPLLTDDEIDAVWDAIPQNQFWWRRYARAIEQAVRAKMGVAQEDTDRLQWLADNMMMQSGYKNTGTWALPDLPWVASGRESCLIEDLRCVIDTHIEQSRLSKEGA